MTGILQEEYPFSFIGDPSSLQCLASSELVLNLWRFKYFNRPPSERDGDTFPLEFLQRIRCSSDEIVGLPNRMKMAIDEKIEEMGDQIFFWMHYHLDQRCILFYHEFHDVFFKCLKSIVLNQHGVIGYKETALNLVRGTQLSCNERFIMACSYCLEDDIKRIWPDVSRNSLTVNDKYSLTNFWTNRLRSRHDRFKMITRFHKLYKNWEALEYFFNFLTDPQKISLTGLFLRRKKNKISLRLLRKLNKNLTREVFKLQACKILTNLTKKEEHIRHLLELWAVVKDSVFEKPIVFLDILHDLWKKVFNGSSWDCVRLDLINSFLIEVWTGAPDKLRSYALNNYVDLFFGKLTSNESKFDLYYGHDMTFLLQLFMNSSYEVRNQLWQKNWRKLVLRAKPFYLEQFMRSALLNQEAVEEFKKSSMFGFKPIFRCFCELGMYSDFICYVRFLSKDPKIMLDTIKRVLKSNVGTTILWLLDSCSARKFDEFICSIFSYSMEDIAKFKEQLASCPRAIESLYHVHCTYRVEEFNNTINTLITSDEKLRKLKRRCLDFSRDHLATDRAYFFSPQKWQNWLKWCTTSDKELLTFRKSLSIDAVLEKQIANFKRKFEVYEEDCIGGLYFFDQFAKWYFPNEEARKKFKIRKITEYKKSSAIVEFLKFGSRCQISTMVNWFYEDNLTKSREFLLSYRCT